MKRPALILKLEPLVNVTVCEKLRQSCELRPSGSLVFPDRHHQLGIARRSREVAWRAYYADRGKGACGSSPAETALDPRAYQPQGCIGDSTGTLEAARQARAGTGATTRLAPLRSRAENGCAQAPGESGLHSPRRSAGEIRRRTQCRPVKRKTQKTSRCLTVQLVGQALPTLVPNGGDASVAGGHTSTTAKATRTVRSGIGSATTC
jgi:hypothetical protein